MEPLPKYWLIPFRREIFLVLCIPVQNKAGMTGRYNGSSSETNHRIFLREVRIVFRQSNLHTVGFKIRQA